VALPELELETARAWQTLEKIVRGGGHEKAGPMRSRLSCRAGDQYFVELLDVEGDEVLLLDDDGLDD